MVCKVQYRLMTSLGDVTEELVALPLVELDLSRLEVPPGLFTAVGEVLHELRLRESLRRQMLKARGFPIDSEAGPLKGQGKHVISEMPHITV